MEELPVKTPHEADLGVTDANSVVQHGIENRLQLARRTGDNLEYLAGRGLLLQSLAQLARPRLHFVEQPRVLDRDHRLVSESGDQLDLLLRERLDLRTGEENCADGHSLAHEWHTERCPEVKVLRVLAPCEL